MIRVLAFLIAVGCCIGLISGSYRAISDTGDDVTFTETVRFGDPSVMDGRIARFGVRCGDHMLWDFTYRFAAGDSHDTEFVFSQNWIPESSLHDAEVLSVYAHTGVGMSTSGGDGISVSATGYGNMIRAVADMTPDGEEFAMNLKLKDYVDYHELNFEINYWTDEFICVEYVDLFSSMTGPGVYDSPCYDAFKQLFRFPVLEDQIVSVTLEKSAEGNITALYYNMETDVQISILNDATGNGIYCIPVYRASNRSTTVIPGEYALGSGLYFIPWKAADSTQVIYENGRQAITLDVANAENLYPLPETAWVCGLRVEEQTNTAWILSLEEGVYVLTWLDLAEGKVLSRLELMPCGPAPEESLPVWYVRDGLMAVRASGALALVTTEDSPNLEFVVALGEAAAGFYYFEQETGNMIYEDGVLYLADVPYYNEHLNVMAYDKTGPLFWGNYECSLFACDVLGGSPDLQNRYALTGLE